MRVLIGHFLGLLQLGLKLRKGLGFIMCLLILVGGCGDGGGSSTVVDSSNSPCGGSAPGQTKFKSEDRSQGHGPWIFPSIQKVFKQGFQSLQQSLRDRMKAFGMMGEGNGSGWFRYGFREAEL